MPNVRASSGMIGTTRAPMALSRSRLAQQPREHHRRRHRLLPRARVELGEDVGRGLGDGLGPRHPPRERAVERAPALHHVLVLRRVGARVEVRRLLRLQRLVGDLVLHVEPVAEEAQLVLRHLLELVGGVARLEVGPEGPALDRLGQDGGRGAFVLDRGLVGGVELAVVVPPRGQVAQVVVGEVLDHLAQPRVGTEEVLADVGAALDRVLLELAVDGGVHLVEQDAVGVAGQELVPLRAPDDLDDVPARAPEDGLELLDDLAVAPDRPVEALQVAVDDEDEVVELLARRDRERAERLGLVALAVAQVAPHTRAAGVGDLPVEQVAVEAGLVDRVDGAEAHRHRRELPELRHQARVGVAREPVAADLHAEAVEVLGREPALEERARVDAGRGVALEVHLVAGLAVVLAAEEVVEADLVERRARRERGQVPADARRPVVGPADHHRRVPADEGADAALDVLVAREPRLLLGRDRVDVGRRHLRGQAHLLLPGPLEQLQQQELGARLPLALEDRVERVDPLGRLLGIDVGQLLGEPVEDHGPYARASRDLRRKGRLGGIRREKIEG